VKQRKEDWKELMKQLQKNKTLVYILRSWKTHLLPILDLPQIDDIVTTLIVPDETSFMLEYAIQAQTAIGWDKLLLGLGSSVWKSLQHHPSDVGRRVILPSMGQRNRNNKR